MFAIAGAFGQTGRAACDALLSAHQPVRMIAHREHEDARAWRDRGAEIVVADMADVAAMTHAFEGASGVYLLNPPAYYDRYMFDTARAVHASLIEAAQSAGVCHGVALSSVGGHQPSGTGNILTTYDFEQQLLASSLECPRLAVTVLRSANFMENWSWSLEPVIANNTLPSMFRPLDRKLPMVSVLDIGRTAADLLLQGGAGHRIVELHGPEAASPQDSAHVFGELLDRQVRAVEAETFQWSQALAQRGFPNEVVEAFVDMFQGFNNGRIAFEGTHETRYGSVTLREALAQCLQQVRKQPTSAVH